MLDLSDNINNILLEIFGSMLENYEKFDTSLPLYLKSGRWFRSVRISGTEFVIVGMNDDESFSITSFRKQYEKYSEKFLKDIAFSFSAVTSYQRKALIENGIPFVTENGQVYLPFLGSLFSRGVKQIRKSSVEKFTPSIQMLFLLLLYIKNGEPVSKSTAASMLHISPMSVTRASAALESAGLIKVKKEGTASIISMAAGRQESFDKAFPYLINPVRRSLFVKQEHDYKLIHAGEFALSERSEFGYPRFREYAVPLTNPVLKNIEEKDPGLSNDEDLIKFQLWRYDPALFSYTGVIDPVSLILSFNGDEDERIHKCLGQIRKEIDNWQIMMK